MHPCHFLHRSDAVVVPSHCFNYSVLYRRLFLHVIIFQFETNDYNYTGYVFSILFENIYLRFLIVRENNPVDFTLIFLNFASCMNNSFKEM